MSNIIDEIDKASMRDDIPEFRPGDSVKVHVKVVEGSRTRVQVFAGTVISRTGGAVRRAKLYYLRGLRGKAAKIKEKGAAR